jgi:hypothetical protein
LRRSASELQSCTDAEAWASRLNRLPIANLILTDREPTNVDNPTYLEHAFFAQGVSTEHLTIFGNTDRTSHFSAYQMIGIALDPFPHGGGLTTLDAIWMGVPVLTWPGKLFLLGWQQQACQYRGAGKGGGNTRRQGSTGETGGGAEGFFMMRLPAKRMASSCSEIAPVTDRDSRWSKQCATSTATPNPKTQPASWPSGMPAACN